MTVEVNKYSRPTDALFVYGGNSSQTATTMQQMQDFMRLQGNSVGDLVDSIIWQPTTEYGVGKVVKSPNMPDGYSAYVTQSGTTGTEEPIWSTSYTTYTDGTVNWSLKQDVAKDEVVLKNQGSSNSGKFLQVGENGDVGLIDSGYRIVETLPSVSEALDNVIYFLIENNSIKTYIKSESSMVEVGNNDSIPIGSIQAYAGAGDIPNGYLLCNGASVGTQTYPALFEAIGYTYGGSGDYFNLPNLNDNRFIEGSDVAGTYKEAGLPNIEGVISGFGSSNCFSEASTNGSFYIENPASANVVTSGSTKASGSRKATFDASLSSSVYGNAETVQPKSLTIRYIIKAFAGASASSSDVDITNVANDVVKLAGTSEIVASGVGYVRYANGLQMCWGKTSTPNGEALASFSLPFINTDFSIVATAQSGSAQRTVCIYQEGTLTNSSVALRVVTSNGIYAAATTVIHWNVCGQWK